MALTNIGILVSALLLQNRFGFVIIPTVPLIVKSLHCVFTFYTACTLLLK